MREKKKPHISWDFGSNIWKEKNQNNLSYQIVVQQNYTDIWRVNNMLLNVH